MEKNSLYKVSYKSKGGDRIISQTVCHNNKIQAVMKCFRQQTQYKKWGAFQFRVVSVEKVF